jgi:hypothetical protein
MCPGYNQGTGDDRREALKGAVDYTRLLTTLATGAVVLSATFLDKFYAGRDVGLLIASWVVLGASVLAGLFAVGEYVNQFAESTLRVRRDTMEVMNLLQFILMVAGVVLFAVFVVLNVRAAPAIEIGRDESGIKSGVAKTAIVCPSDAVNGCSGTVTFQLLIPHAVRPIDLGTAPFAAEHPELSTVSAPRSLSGALQRSLSSDRLRIVVHGHGRYGNARTIDETVPAKEARTAG